MRPDDRIDPPLPGLVRHTGHADLVREGVGGEVGA